MNLERHVPTEYIIGFDIGGGSVRAAAYPIIHGKLGPARHVHKEQARHDLLPHAEQVTTLLRVIAHRLAQDGCKIVGVGVGAPGRFDEKGATKPGTAPHSGKGFDGAVLADEYRKALRKINAKYLADLPIIVNNDANAMLVGHIQALQNGETLNDDQGEVFNKFSLANKQIGLFGIGSGVGHSIIKFDKGGNYEFVTDGHASKLMVEIDAEDRELYAKAKETLQKTDYAFYEGLPTGWARAEDLFKSNTIAAIAGVEDNKEIIPTNSDHQKALQFAGKYMARLVAKIKSGESQDVDPINGWNDASKAIAAQTQAYLIGGGTGTSALGKELIAVAEDELKKLGINDIRLVHFNREEENCLAAASLILPNIMMAQAKAVRAA